MITTLFCLACGPAMIISALAVWFGSSRTLVVRERGRERLLKNKQSHSVSRDDEHREIVTSERINFNAEISFTNCFLGLVFLLKEWFNLLFAMKWKQANRTESAGENRPSLTFYLVLALNAAILSFRTTMQFFSLLLLKRRPNIDFLPLCRHSLMGAATSPHSEWKKIQVKIQEKYDCI